MTDEISQRFEEEFIAFYFLDNFGKENWILKRNKFLHDH
jgi:hypothetical protein